MEQTGGRRKLAREKRLSAKNTYECRNQYLSSFGAKDIIRRNHYICFWEQESSTSIGMSMKLLSTRIREVELVEISLTGVVGCCSSFFDTVKCNPPKRSICIILHILPTNNCFSHEKLIDKYHNKNKLQSWHVNV